MIEGIEMNIKILYYFAKFAISERAERNTRTARVLVRSIVLSMGCGRRVKKQERKRAVACASPLLFSPPRLTSMAATAYAEDNGLYQSLRDSSAQIHITKKINISITIAMFAKWYRTLPFISIPSTYFSVFLYFVLKHSYI